MVSLKHCESKDPYNLKSLEVCIFRVSKRKEFITVADPLINFCSLNYASISVPKSGSNPPAKLHPRPISA